MGLAQANDVAHMDVNEHRYSFLAYHGSCPTIILPFCLLGH